MSAWPRARAIPDLADLPVEVRIGNRSTHYAARWLEMLGARRTAPAEVTVVAGESGHGAVASSRCTIRLWDFGVGRPGTGALAAAAAGAATVIGHADGPSVGLPVDVPEKWCGAYAAILALAEHWRSRSPRSRAPTLYDVSTAEVLRAFALQNAGTAEEAESLWHRNGRVPVRHGGIFPMGFFACRDGHVALLGRSRRDWKNIRLALDSPAWAEADAFADPFGLAKEHAEADRLLEGTLGRFSRDELLGRGLAHGAVIAPVYSQREARERGVFRRDFETASGPAMPFLVEREAGDRSAPDRDRMPERSPPARGRRRRGPLTGLRCIELCWIWSGPLVGQILADLGAEVIKVESRNRFDLYRTRGLEARRGEMPESVRIESSLYFHSLNRNKLGLTVDLKDPRGIEIMQSLIAASDLLLDNFTAGTLDRLGLTRAVMHEANPALTVLSMSGPGRESELQALRSYGLVLSALGGAEHLIESDGEFVGSPTYSISDPNAALFATLAALGGVHGARNSSRGMSVDVSQIEAAGTLVGTPVHGGRTDGYAAFVDDRGVERALSVPASLDAADLARTLHGASAEAIASRCRSLGVGHTEVRALDDTAASEAFDCDGRIDATHPTTGPERLVAAPWWIDGERPAFFNAAPRLGEDNDDVLRRVLGLSDDAIAQLAANEVI